MEKIKINEKEKALIEYNNYLLKDARESLNIKIGFLGEDLKKIETHFRNIEDTVFALCEHDENLRGNIENLDSLISYWIHMQDSMRHNFNIIENIKEIEVEKESRKEHKVSKKNNERER
jgi:hypothetical protein